MSISTRIRTAAVAALAVCAVAPLATSATATAAPVKPAAQVSHPVPAGVYRGGRVPMGILRGGRRARLRSASTSVVQSLTFSGTCNYYTHQNTFSASVSLNSSRFPNGGQVWARYASQKSTSSTPTPWGGWYGPYTVNNYLGTTAPDALGPGVPMYGPQSLPAISFNYTSGQFYGAVQLAVKTGATTFDYNAWTWADSYLNSGQFGMSPVNASTCWVSG